MAKFTKLFVGGLPRSVAETELDEVFSRYGDVHRTLLVRNPDSGRSRLFGFVEMLDSQDARRAIDALHGCEVEGCTLSVRIADNSQPLRPPGPEALYRDVCVKNLAYEASEKALRELFGAIAPPRAIRFLLSPRTGASTGIAFVTLSSAAEAELVLQLDQTMFAGRMIHVNPESDVR